MLAVFSLWLISGMASGCIEGTYDVPDTCKGFEYQFAVVNKLSCHAEKLEVLRTRMEKQRETIQDLKQEIEVLKGTKSPFPGGSTYVRWGRNFCPEGADMVYKGFAGGSHFTHSGAAANYLCLPEDPTWGDLYNDATSNIGAFVHGAEYQTNERKDGNWNQNLDLHDRDVPCAVCRSSRTAMVMIPGRNNCYPSWNLEYVGFLAAGHCGHNAASEFVCLDAKPEMLTGRSSSKDGKLFYLAEARTESLGAPYVNGREFYCVVCTK